MLEKLTTYYHRFVTRYYLLKTITRSDEDELRILEKLLDYLKGVDHGIYNARDAHLIELETCAETLGDFMHTLMVLVNTINTQQPIDHVLVKRYIYHRMQPLDIYLRDEDDYIVSFEDAILRLREGVDQLKSALDNADEKWGPYYHRRMKGLIPQIRNIVEAYYAVVI